MSILYTHAENTSKITRKRTFRINYKLLSNGSTWLRLYLKKVAHLPINHSSDLNFSTGQVGNMILPLNIATFKIHFSECSVIAHTWPFITGLRVGQKLCPLPRPARQFATPFAVVSCQNGIHKTGSSASQSPIFVKLSPFISPDNASIKSGRHLLWIGVWIHEWLGIYLV